MQHKNLCCWGFPMEAFGTGYGRTNGTTKAHCCVQREKQQGTAKKMTLAKYTKVHKLLPTGLVNNMELLTKYAFGESVIKRLELYEKYLSVRDKYYIDRAIDNTVNRSQTAPLSRTVHIQGELHSVFPIANIRDCTKVKNGGHAMIINRTKWFNENLPAIILEERNPNIVSLSKF